jgi:hypothetical protein
LQGFAGILVAVARSQAAFSRKITVIGDGIPRRTPFDTISPFLYFVEAYQKGKRRKDRHMNYDSNEESSSGYSLRMKLSGV